MQYPLYDRAPKFEFNEIGDYVHWGDVIVAAKKIFPIPSQERFSGKGATSALYSEFDGLLKQN